MFLTGKVENARANKLNCYKPGLPTATPRRRLLKGRREISVELYFSEVVLNFTFSEDVVRTLSHPLCPYFVTNFTE